MTLIPVAAAAAEEVGQVMVAATMAAVVPITEVVTVAADGRTVAGVLTHGPAYLMIAAGIGAQPSLAWDRIPEALGAVPGIRVAQAVPGVALGIR